MKLTDQQSAKESYAELISENSKSVLIDVRSKREWLEVGVADFLSTPKKLVLCEWLKSPSMEPNINFFNELTEQLDFQKLDYLYFICAAGVRSQQACNYTRNKFEDLDVSLKCINVSDGFSGKVNSFLGFGKVGGWKGSGLPCCDLKQLAYEN